MGYSGEDVPNQAPSNLTLVQITDSRSALLAWDSVPPESVKGHFMGYKIQTWNEKDGEQDLRETHIKGEQNRALVNKFTPFSKNYARVLVYNGRCVRVLYIK